MGDLTSTTESRRRWPRHDAQLPMMGTTKEKKVVAGLLEEVRVGLWVWLGSLYREQVKTCIKSECVGEEMLMSE